MRCFIALEGAGPPPSDSFPQQNVTTKQEWVLERYEGAPVELVGSHRKYLELETSAADDDGQPFVTPTVIYRWAH